MPRGKSTVGFWRGPAQTNKPALLPAPDRWTGTAVDGWPSSLLHGLRRELLAVKRTRPDTSDAELVGHANAWLQTNHAPTSTGSSRKRKGAKAGGSPRSVSAHHVRALLNPPARQSPKPKKPTEIDRTPRPTTLSGEELARVIRRNQAAAPKPRAPRPTAQQSERVTKPKRKRRQPKPRKSPDEPKNPKRIRGPLPRAAMRAGVSPRGPFVMWPAAVHGAVSVKLDVWDLRRVRVRTVEVKLAARYALFEAPARGFEVTARFLDKHGKTVAQGRAAHRPPPG